MQAIDPLTYSAALALPHRAVVTYRYVRLGSAQFKEDDARDQPIRYRLFYASGPGEVHDVVSGWSDKSNMGETGSIQGRVLNVDTGAPIPDILVAAGGQRASPTPQVVSTFRAFRWARTTWLHTPLMAHSPRFSRAPQWLPNLTRLSRSR